MRKNKIMKVAVEVAISRAIKDIRNDPKRGVRNLVDLGMHFCTTRDQKQYFQRMQQELLNENSPYYTLLRNIVDFTDPKLIKDFSINFGYNGCLLGSKRIRSSQIKLQCRIPWVISFELNLQPEQLTLDQISAVISQGKAMGIFSYILRCKSASTNMASLYKLFFRHSDCAFLLFLPENAVKTEDVKYIRNGSNVMSSIPADKESSATEVQKLFKSQCLFSTYLYYNAENVDKILSGAWIDKRLPSSFVFLVASDDCDKVTANKVEFYVRKFRDSPSAPILLVDFYSDLKYLDQAISKSKPRIVEINPDGSLKGKNSGTNLNLKNSSLTVFLQG